MGNEAYPCPYCGRAADTSVPAEELVAAKVSVAEAEARAPSEISAEGNLADKAVPDDGEQAVSRGHRQLDQCTDQGTPEEGFQPEQPGNPLCTQQVFPQRLRSALKRPSVTGTSISQGTGQRATITFADRPDRTTMIQNWSHLADMLWYPGFVVVCDRCERSVEWGHEGNIAGAPGRSRFSQWQVLCSTCMADRLYAEIGAWLVVALAASASEDPNVGSGVAQGPVTTLLDTLLQTSPAASCGGTDLLVALLGPEAEPPEVRETVLRKARNHVSTVLGQRSSTKRTLPAAEEEEPFGSC